MSTLGAAAKSERGEENVPNASKKNAATRGRLRSAGRGGRGVKLKRKGSLGKNSVAVMLLDGECFPQDKR